MSGDEDRPKEPTEEDIRTDAFLEFVETLLDELGEKVGVSRATLIRELRRRDREQDS